MTRSHLLILSFATIKFHNIVFQLFTVIFNFLLLFRMVLFQFVKFGVQLRKTILINKQNLTAIARGNTEVSSSKVKKKVMATILQGVENLFNKRPISVMTNVLLLHHYTVKDTIMSILRKVKYALLFSNTVCRALS